MTSLPSMPFSSPSVFDELPSPSPAAPDTLAQRPSASSTGGDDLGLRAFDDVDSLRTAIYDKALTAATKLPPVANTRYTLGLSDVRYVDPDRRSKAEHKKALLEGGTLGRRLQGTWKLTDNATGQEVAKRTATLASIPHLTDLGTFVHNGSDYVLSNQLRLRSGVYTRIKENGELEAHVNVKSGEGVSHRLFMDPETGVFRMQLGQARLPLISVLRSMGLSDSQLRDAWGNELFAANKTKDDASAITKLHQRLLRKAPTDPESGAKSVAEAFQKMKLDPEVTQQTLGQPYDSLSPDAMLAITKKLLAINRGEAATDDRDHMAFQHFVGPDDLFAERIERSRALMQKQLWKATAKRTLDHINARNFTDHIYGALLDSGLGGAPEEVNPGEMLDYNTRVTRMGVGGIPSVDSIPDEARAVQPSQLAYIDALRTSESEKAGVDLRLARGARRGKDGRIYSPMRDARTGQTVYKSPQDVADSVVAFPGELERQGPLAAALVHGRIKMVPRDQVQFAVPHMEETFSPLGTMIPLKSTVKGQRAVMAARMLSQALPLVGGEAPFLQSGMAEQPGRSYEEEYGSRMGALFAKQPGQVVAVSPDAIKVRYQDGRVEAHELYNNFALNRKTRIHQTPMVEPGMPVQPGQLLARSNFTDDRGTTALGRNLRVAYVPFHGHNFEDASIISQSAANKFESEHTYQHAHDWDTNDQRGKNNYLGMFPSRFDAATLKQFDDDGVIRPGTEVKEGDPLVLIARKRTVPYGAVHRKNTPSFSDESIVWKHHRPGIVTDVARTKSGVNVVVKSTDVAQIGDKLCYDPLTRLLTKARGWVPVAAITTDDEVATVNPATDELEWQRPTHLHQYDHVGDMYELKTKQLDMLVTLEHGLWVARPGEAYRRVTAGEFYESKGEWQFKKDCRWRGVEQPFMDFVDARKYRSDTQTLTRVAMDDWLEFLGFYIAEGWCSVSGSKRADGTRPGRYVKIGQYRASCHWATLRDVLNRLGLRWRYSEQDGRFEIGNVWLYDQLVALGNSYTKYVPAYVQELSPRQLAIFLDAYLAGDGHKGACWEYGTSSERLAYDIQLICMKLGWAAHVKKTVRTDNWAKHPHWRAKINRRHLRPWWKKGRAKQYPRVVSEAIVPYSGKVYCVTVPNHVLIVERNSKTYLSLNSGRYG